MGCLQQQSNERRQGNRKLGEGSQIRPGSIKRRSGGVARGLISPPPYKAPVITRQELIQTQTKGVLVLQVIHEKPEISINRCVTTFFPRPPLSELLALVSRERGQVIHLSEVNLKGRVAVPKRMNLRKNFKRHLTPPPHFRKIILQFFPEKPSLKPYVKV